MRRLYVLFLACLGALSTSCPGDLEVQLKKFGYTVLRPASTFWQPGAIVYVTREKPLELGFICTAEEVMGADYSPIESPTSSTVLARITRKAQHFDVDLAETLRAHEGLHAVRSVKMSLTNAQVHEVTDRSVTMRIGKIDPICLWNVRRHLRIGDRVTMIRSALQADVVFTVQYDRAAAVDASAQIAVLKDVALKLGVDGSTLTGRTIEAKELVWGVKVEDSLVDIFDAKSMRRLGLRHASLLKPDDAPVVVEGREIWHREPEVRWHDDVAGEESDEGGVDDEPDARTWSDFASDATQKGSDGAEQNLFSPVDERQSDGYAGVPSTPAWSQGPSLEDVLAAQAAADAKMLQQAAVADDVAAGADEAPRRHKGGRRRQRPTWERRSSLP